MFSNNAHRSSVFAAALACAALTGCGGGRTLVATPNLVCQQDAAYFAACSSCVPEMEVLYVTDRAVIANGHGPSYGYGRAKRLAYGCATIGLTPHPTWEELVVDSTQRQRQRHYTLAPAACRELGGFDFLWEQLREGEGGVPQPGTSMQIPLDQQQAFHKVLIERLAASPHKDVFVFIHGFNNSFADAIYRAGEVWHFMGRVGVPVAYTWPAGHGGPLGYLYDRESGEFTVFHLKQFLRCLADCPGIERIHIVAHSRGTDVAISALRELHTMYQAEGRDTRLVLKLENLVLAAPDLDEDVFVQRFIAENLLSASRRTTIYTSPWDRAIEASDFAFRSRHRLGALGPSDFSPAVRQALARLPMLQFVDCKVTHFSTSHDYVFAHPAALSDLILVLRERRDPGAEHGRPLRQAVQGVWELGNDYLQVPTPAGPRPAAK